MKPGRKKGSKRMGRFLFFLPVAAVIALMAIGLVTYVSSESGTLVVQAWSSSRYTASVQLHVPVTIGAATQTAPFNASLPAGHYSVVFGQLNWYATPLPRTIAVSGGKTQFAVEVYVPIIRVITVSQNGFNSTWVTVLHGVTPVVWINQGSTVVTLEISGAPRAFLYPSQSHTAIFSAPGTYTFDIVGTSFSGTVSSE